MSRFFWDTNEGKMVPVEHPRLVTVLTTKQLNSFRIHGWGKAGPFAYLLDDGADSKQDHQTKIEAPTPEPRPSITPTLMTNPFQRSTLPQRETPLPYKEGRADSLPYKDDVDPEPVERIDDDDIWDYGRE